MAAKPLAAGKLANCSAAESRTDRGRISIAADSQTSRSQIAGFNVCESTGSGPVLPDSPADRQRTTKDLVESATRWVQCANSENSRKVVRPERSSSRGEATMETNRRRLAPCPATPCGNAVQMIDSDGMTTPPGSGEGGAIRIPVGTRDEVGKGLLPGSIRVIGGKRE